MSTRPAPRVARLLGVALLPLLLLVVSPLQANARSAHRQVGALKRSAPSAGARAAFAAATTSTARTKRATRRVRARANRGLLFGAHVDGDVYGGNLDRTDALERTLGRRISISQWYQSWGGNDWVRQVQPQLIRAVAATGRTPLLTWEPWNAESPSANQANFSLDAINNGRHDAYIAAWADGLRATGTPVYLRLMHEMNGNWYPWGAGVNGNTPAKYQQAWRHVVDIFRARGASNVRFVWCPMTESTPNTPGNQLERYYPGAGYVDVLALDGYNWGSNQPSYGGWRSFRQIFEAPYQRLTKLGSQPIWIAEVASAPEGGSKAAWVRGMFRTAASWKRLSVLVWFDVNKEEDWRAAPDARVAAAFRG